MMRAVRTELTGEEVDFLSEIMYLWYGCFGKGAVHSMKRYRSIARKLGVVEKLQDLDAWTKS